MTEVVDWIWKAPTPEERLKRIEEFLTNEGYSKEHRERWYVGTFYPVYY